MKSEKVLSIIGTSLVVLLLVLMFVGIYRVYKLFTSIDVIQGEEYIGKEIILRILYNAYKNNY